MEAKHPQCPHSSASLSESPKQRDFFQEPSNSHQPPSESSQTYTGAPSGTGDGASGQSMTATTANFDPITDQAALDHQYSPVSSPDQRRDLGHIGSWATTIESFDDTLVIRSDSILFPNHQSVAAANATNTGDGFAGPVGEGEATKEEAVELFRANLRRKV